MTQPRETVLILEDDAGIARLQQRILERSGFNVDLCTRPDEARRRIEKGGIDLMLLDNRLENVEGLEFYRELKEAGFDLPVILVTGFSDDATVIRAFRSGVLDYVTKSSEYLSYLPEAVRRALAQVRTRCELHETNAQLRRALTNLEAKTEELKAATQQLWQAAKLASVGEMAASIAHELNNPLGIISLRLEGIIAKTPADDPRRKPLEVIDQELERMAGLVSNLLHFSRPGWEEASSVDVSEEATRTIELMNHHLRKRGVSVSKNLATEPVRILADRQKLRQVFLNLVTNAADAMTAGGTLTLTVRSAMQEGGKSVAVIEVGDTGHGIPPEVLPKVMEPFFSTKEEGKGTGLGLAICRRIVQEHGGSIHIESAPEQGTMVRIVLPKGNGTNVSGLK